MPNLDRPAVLEEPELDGLVRLPVTHRRHRQVHARLVQDSFRRGHAENLAIARESGRAEAKGVNRCGRFGAAALDRPTRIAAVREDNDAGDGASAVSVARRGERAGEIAATRRGTKFIGRRWSERFPEGEDLGLEPPIQGRQQFLRQ